MAKKSQEAIDLESAQDTIRDIYDLVQESGSTRAEMQDALDNIANLCTEEIPELGEDDDGENDDDDDSNE